MMYHMLIRTPGKLDATAGMGNDGIKAAPFNRAVRDMFHCLPTYMSSIYSPYCAHAMAVANIKTNGYMQMV